MIILLNFEVSSPIIERYIVKKTITAVKSKKNKYIIFRIFI